MGRPFWKTDWFLGLAIVLGVAFAIPTEPLRQLDGAAYDLSLRFSGARQANDQVAVIAVDDASLRALGAWPLSRDVLADLNRRLAAARPAAVGYLLPLDSQQNPAGVELIRQLQVAYAGAGASMPAKVRTLLSTAEGQLDSDAAFAASLRGMKRVYLAMPYGQAGAELPEGGRALARHTLRNVPPAPDPPAFSPPGGRRLPPAVEGLRPPLVRFAQAAAGVGAVPVRPSWEDLRAVPLVVRDGERYYPTLPLLLAAGTLGLSTEDVQAIPGAELRLAGRVLNTDPGLHAYPYYYPARDGAPPFPVYSLAAVLGDQVPAASFHNKTVLVGLAAAGLASPVPTPLGEALPPLLAVAHVVSALLNGDLYRVPGWSHWVQLSALILVAAYLMFLLPRFRLGTGLALTALLLAALANVHFVLMLSQSVWVPLMAPLLALVLGNLLLGGRRLLARPALLLRHELDESNRLLGQNLQSQGQLDQAFERYRRCRPDAGLLELVYNLGLDYERRRQFSRALAAFRFVEGHAPGFRDSTERIARNQEMDNLMVLGKPGAASPAGTVIISANGLQKPMLGRYEVQQELGRGAMGMVYLGRDPKIGRTVAIKTMSLSHEFEGEQLQEVRERFFREAETAGRLNHPNIVHIYDVGEEQDLAYIAMDYLQGTSLMTYGRPENLLPLDTIFDIMIKVAEALTYAHTQSVVHRDIKPANIIYNPETGAVKVTDFGVACLVDASQTKTGTILGSPSYMSPEQLAGEKVDGRSDLFSLGVTFYQLLAGELPFVGDSLASLMYKIANAKHPDVRMFRPDLPNCVSKIVNKALHKDPERRFQSGSDFANVLRRCQSHIPDHQGGEPA